MLKREYFDTETNMVSTTSMTAIELLVAIENRLKKFETKFYDKEILIHALILASIFPQDNKSHLNDPHYFISLVEYTEHDIDLLISLVSEKFNIAYKDLKLVYDYIINNYSIKCYDGGVRKKEFQLPTYAKVICDLYESLRINSIVSYEYDSDLECI